MGIWISENIQATKVIGSKRKILVFFILGFVSLFADMTYEGARSVIGPYMEVLGASALVASLVALGEFIGYVLRLVSGLIVGKLRSSRVLWGLTIGGYIVNLTVVPLLALARDWQIALALVILERSGKGLRTPARDVVLAETSEEIGMGKGFGIHELLDQIGAIAGPLLISFLVAGRGFRASFKYLAFPAAISITLIVIASLLYPHVKSVERKFISEKILSLKFILIMTFVSLLSIGFLHWSIISYYIENLKLIPNYTIPLLYAIAMAVDAALAVPLGILYDKYGSASLIVAPLLAFSIPILLALRAFPFLLAVAMFWGATMSVYETIMKALVANSVKPENRAYAFGIYNFIFGISWMIGNLIAGFLYTKSLFPVKLIMPVIALISLLPLSIAMFRNHKLT